MKRGLIDQVEFSVWAGNGGRGVVHFRREKYIRKGGPDGGDGGNGGSIYFLTSPHITTLLDFTGKIKYEADYGGAGRGQKMHGKDAKDLVLRVPVGTVVYEKDENNQWVKLFDLDKPNEKALIAQGGAGGRGNTAFKSPINTTPMFSEPGGHGERKVLKLEMKILADVGLVGLPNTGKSTLLSVMTAARPEIANYPFTTITPNLGVIEAKNSKGEVRNIVMADIPGLIEDAHKGKGLGVDFLRHIERCRVLIYIISPMDSDLSLTSAMMVKALVKQYQVVKNEVVSYGQGVDDKQKLVVVNKMDLMDEKIEKKIVKEFKKIDEEVIFISAATQLGIEKLKTRLVDVNDSERNLGSQDLISVEN